MKTPGITVKPIEMMNGQHSFNEVFLDNVKVPVNNRIGEENKGWGVTKTLSNFERSGALPVGYLERTLERLIDYCKETRKKGELLINNPLIRNRLASLAVEIETAKAIIYKITYMHAKGEMLQSMTAASAAKVFTAEVFQRMVFAGCDILGEYCQVKENSKWKALNGLFEVNYQFHMGMNIAAGTSEIQRNIIAWIGLGLPR